MDRSRPVTTLGAAHSDGSLPGGTAPLGGPEASMLKQQVKQGDLAGLREYLARTRKERDWQDRFFMLGLVVPSARLAALDFACEAEPEAADLFLIRCAFFCELAATMRGGGTCEQVGEERLRNAAECIRAALTDLDKATQLDGQDPTAYAYVLPSLTIFGQLLPRQQYAFQRATELAPDFVPAYRAIVTTLSERWHGSHEKSLQFARFALTKAGPGSDMPVCLFWAHLLVRTHLSSFDKNMEAAKAYIRNPEVNKELASAFDSWTEGLEVATRSSIPYLHHAACWFYLADDRARLKRALSLTNNVFSKVPWSWFGNATEVYANAVLAAAGQQPQQRDKSDPCAECLTIVAYSTDAMQNGKTAEAERGLAAALVLARSSPEQASHLVPLVLLYLASLRKTQRRDEDSRKLREQAVAMLDANSAPLSVARYQHLMANVLNKLGEYQRSLPFWEQAIQLTGEETSAEQMASMLHDMGTCYSRVGLRDHATIPLRAAIKVFAAGPSDPRLPVALLSLGNALRKSSPVEAEACYKQAAELHAAQAQYESAASAWVNLGVLSSAQGRHSEALEHYDRALKVREQTRGTPPAKIALILNKAITYLTHRVIRPSIEAMELPHTLQEAIVYFADADRAFQYALNLRFPNGVVSCPRCGSEKHSFIKTRRIWFCAGCKKQFSLKVGTIFEDSPIGLDKWMCAYWILCNSKNGVSSCEIARTIGVTQKTAWFMMHRVRTTMHDDSAVKLSGEVEADETFIGGKARNMHLSVKARRITGTGTKDKTAVMGILERGGKVRTTVVANRKKAALQAEVKKHVEAGAALYTDALLSYDGLAGQYAHQVVDHAVEYVNGRIHTNGLENFWSLLKRGINGTYVSIEPFHLFRYLDEQSFRYNNRKNMDDQARFEMAMSNVFGHRLTYTALTGAATAH